MQRRGRVPTLRSGFPGARLRPYARATSLLVSPKGVPWFGRCGITHRWAIWSCARNGGSGGRRGPVSHRERKQPGHRALLMLLECRPHVLYTRLRLVGFAGPIVRRGCFPGPTPRDSQWLAGTRSTRSRRAAQRWPDLVEDRRELGDPVGERRAVGRVREQLAPVDALGAVAPVDRAQRHGRRDGAGHRIDLADRGRDPPP